MEDRLKFRIPMFTDKGNFQEFQYLELGEQVECTLCGYNGEPQQCTGLKDKNGKLIYEGDIVKVGKWDLASRDSFSEDEYIEKIGVINYYQPYCRFLVNHLINAEALEVYLPECCLGILGHCNIEVIGNIYENPELLED